MSKAAWESGTEGPELLQRASWQPKATPRAASFKWGLRGRLCSSSSTTNNCSVCVGGHKRHGHNLATRGLILGLGEMTTEDKRWLVGAI